MRLVLLLLLLSSTVFSWRSRRLRRQFLPSQHVQVHSIDSGVTVDGTVTVESGENRIDFDEMYMNGSLWSDHSLLNFDNQDTFSKVSADNSEALFNLQGHIQVHSQGLKGDFFVHTNRSTDGHTAVDHHVFGAANFSFDDGVMKVQGVQGKRVGMEAQTWDREMERTITLEASTLPSGERELRLEANGKPYHAVICFEGAVVYFQYAGKYIKLDPSYRFIEISTDKYTVTIKTENAPFHVTLSKNEIVILLPQENTRVCVYPDGVAVQSSQLTKTHIDRNGGRMSIGGKPVVADGVMITALNTDLDMSNGGKVNSNTQNSFLMIESNIQPVGLTARHHNLKINDGIPHITIDPGLSIVEIQTNHGVFSLQSLMAPFRPRDDKFVDIGPFRVMTSKSSSYGPPRNIPPPPAFPPPNMLPPPIPFQEQGPPPIPEPAPPPPHALGAFGGAVPFSPQPLPFNGVHHGMPAFAADLPPVLGGSSVKTTTILEKTTNITTVSSTHEGAKKKGIKLDPMLALAMAADLPPVIRPEIKVTSTTEAPTTTTTKGVSLSSMKNVTTVEEQLNVTTTKTNKPKVIVDPLLLKAMAADLPSPMQPQVSNNNQNNMDEQQNITTTMADKPKVLLDTLLPKALAAGHPPIMPNKSEEGGESSTRLNTTAPKQTLTAPDDTTNTTSVFEKETNITTIKTLGQLPLPHDATNDIKNLGVNKTFSSLTGDRINVSSANFDNEHLKESSSKTDSVLEKITNTTSVSLTQENNPSMEGLSKILGKTTSETTSTKTAKEREDQKAMQFGNDTVKPSSSASESAGSRQSGGSSVKTTTIVEKTTNITEVNTIQDVMQRMKQGLAADLASITTSIIPPTTTTLLTTITTTPTTTTITTTTTKPTTTTTVDPLEELKKLREEMIKMKQIREWEEREVSQGGDGDEHVEEFTFPNGTTVHRVVKTRRRITTTVTHKHREEVNDTSTGHNGTATLSSGSVDLSKANFTLVTPSTTSAPPVDDEFFKTDTPPRQTLFPGGLKGFRVGKVTLAPIRKTSFTRTFQVPVGA